MRVLENIGSVVVVPLNYATRMSDVKLQEADTYRIQLSKTFHDLTQELVFPEELQSI